MKCHSEQPDPTCNGPFAVSGVYVCYECSRVHDEMRDTWKTCACDDCIRVREIASSATRNAES